MRALALAVIAAGFVACHTAAEPAPFELSPALDELDPAERRVWSSARRTAQMIERIGGVLPDPELEAYATDILTALFPEFAGALRVRVLAQPVVNAITLADGSIYLFTGVVARMENEAQLAAVLAHEGVHFTHRHAYGDRAHARAPLTDSTRRRGRDQEREADRLGLERLVAAGYAPGEAVRALEHLVEIEELYGAEFQGSQATHPASVRRVEDLAALAALHAQEGRTAEAEYLRRTARARVAGIEEGLARFDHRFVLLELEDGVAANAYPRHVDYFLGEAYRLRGEEGDEALAEAAYLRAVERSPAFPRAHRALGRHYLKRGRPELAARHLRRYLALAPDALDRAFVEANLEGIEGGPP